MNQIKYNSSVAGYCLRLYLFCVCLGPAILFLFIPPYSEVRKNIGGFIAVYFETIMQCALFGLPALLIFFICSQWIYEKIKEGLFYKALSLLIAIILILLSYHSPFGFGIGSYSGLSVLEEIFMLLISAGIILFKVP